jgi:fluoride exporter
MTMLWIAIGGALGSLGRYWVSETLALLWGPQFPWGTVLVNVSGSFVIGFVAGGGGAHGRWIDSAFARQFVMIGLCGGYTTFSAFSLQTVAMLQAGDVGRAGLNVVGSVSLCLLATWAGFAAAAALTR